MQDCRKPTKVSRILRVRPGDQVLPDCITKERPIALSGGVDWRLLRYIQRALFAFWLMNTLIKMSQLCKHKQNRSHKRSSLRQIKPALPPLLRVWADASVSCCVSVLLDGLIGGLQHPQWPYFSLLFVRLLDLEIETCLWLRDFLRTSETLSTSTDRNVIRLFCGCFTAPAALGSPQCFCCLYLPTDRSLD